MYLWPGFLRSIIAPVQIPEWPVSETTTAFEGRNSVISLQIRSGLMGTAAELQSGATSLRHSLTSCCTRRTQPVLGSIGFSASINLRKVTLASPNKLTTLG